MMDALKITNLVKKYGNKKTAVDDISFEIKKGEFFGFLGPNGAGKSTTIHCITGISKITSGTIEVFGLDVEKEYKEARKLIGLAPQEFNIDIFSTTQKILDHVAGFYGIRKAEREKRIKELLGEFEIEEYKDMKFRELSGGIKRRVMLARAMVHDPEFIILDEPTAGVDVELRHELWGILKKLNESGKTILLTSHYLEEVELLCERIAFIKNGKIVSLGSKEEFTKDGKTLEQKYLEIVKK